MRKILLFALVFTTAVFGIKDRESLAYDDKTTHPALTDEIVDFYNLSFPDTQLTSQQKEWIVEGAIMEDDPPRWINHFYDPVYKDGWTGERAGDYSSSTMKFFATTGIFMEDSLSAVNWVNNREAQRKYLFYQGDRTWEKALEYYIEGDQEEAYKTLGHTLHLLEDQSAPDHTRNDTHAHELEKITGDYGSPYEEYLKKYNRKSIKELNIPASLKKDGKKPLQQPTVENYLISLAEYSNKNFFSKDTINDQKYEYPKIIEDDGNFGYGKDENGTKFLLVKVKNIKTDGFDSEKIYTLEPNDENILDAYFLRLSRQAVLHGAGVIDLFKKQAEEAVLNNKDYSYSGSRFYIPSVSFTAGLIKLYGAGVAIGNTLSSAYDSAKTSISSILTIDIKRNVGDFATNQTASLLDAVTDEVEVEEEGVLAPVTQGPTLDTAQAEPAPVEASSAPETIQSQALDSTPVVKTSQPAAQSSQPLVFIGGAMPMVAAPAPVPIVQTTTSQTQSTEQATTTDTTATTTPPIDTAPADTIPPIITILGENPLIIYTGDRYVDAGATASDEIDGARTVSTSSSVNTFTTGSYTVTYTATDLAGNVGTATRIVNVLDAVVALSFSDLNGNGIADSDEEEVVVASNASLPAGEYRFNDLVITASSTLTLMSDLTASTTFRGVKITARNITVDLGSSISADMQGYNQEISGLGAASYPGGASYGGAGYGNAVASVYGSAIAPVDLGSSGSSICCSINKNGGGAIRLVVAGTLTNNGNISADGSSPSTSGGSIYITTGNLAGSGNFHANGGSGSTYYYTGAGGGGRVAIYYQNSSYGGTAEALGGLHYDGWSSSSRVGGGTTGFFDMTNNDFYARAPWRFLASDGPFSFNRIVLENGATVGIESGARVTANELLITGASSLSVGSGSTVAIPDISVDGQSLLTFSGGETLAMDTLSIMGTSTVSVAQGMPLVLTARDITLSVGSSINVDGKGYASASGPGKSLNPFGGASHGGIGVGNTATSTYGHAFAPVDMGSGGNGHSSYAYGGGAVKLTASNILTIDGTISADGGQTSSGGGIYLIADTITGSGFLRADGGETYWQGQYIEPGAGGRIALDSPNQAFSGSMSVAGGCRWSSGFLIACSEDGTVVYGASITSFEFPALSPTAMGIINERTHAISIAVPYGTNVTELAPTITLSRGATVTPASGEPQDFTSPVTYMVTSATSSVQTYAVTVTVDSAPPDTAPPSIENYTLNGVGESVTTASTTVAVVLAMTASEDVDWVSIKIEQESNPDNYKIFYSGTGCADDTNTCEKTWDGTLSRGTLEEGTYRIKVHMKDDAGNEFSEYLSPYTITVTQSVAQEE